MSLLALSVVAGALKNARSRLVWVYGLHNLNEYPLGSAPTYLGPNYLDLVWDN